MRPFGRVNWHADDPTRGLVFRYEPGVRRLKRGGWLIAEGRDQCPRAPVTAKEEGGSLGVAEIFLGKKHCKGDRKRQERSKKAELPWVSMYIGDIKRENVLGSWYRRRGPKVVPFWLLWNGFEVSELGIGSILDLNLHSSTLKLSSTRPASPILHYAE